LEFAGRFQWIARTVGLEDESGAVVAKQWSMKAQKKRRIDGDSAQD
jgi:hypothetical protein